MSKIKNGGLDQYGAGPLEQQQLGTAGVEGVNPVRVSTVSFPGFHFGEHSKTLKASSRG